MKNFTVKSIVDKNSALQPVCIIRIIKQKLTKLDEANKRAKKY